MLFSTNKTKKCLYIIIGNHELDLEQVNQLKYLAIVFDDKLSWKSHIQYMCSNFSRGS